MEKKMSYILDKSTAFVIKVQLFFILPVKKGLSIKKISRKTGFHKEVIEEVFERFREDLKILIDKKGNVKYCQIKKK